MKSLGKQEVLAALTRLGELAEEREIALDLCVYGGYAMMLAFDRRAITRDVDAVFHPTEKVLPLIKQVATEQRLPEDWLNDDVRQFLATKESLRELPIDLPGVRLTAPTAGYLLAMKALACRRALPGYKGDEGDLRFLIRRLEISSMEDLQDHIDKYYPDDGPSESGRALLDKIIEEESRG